MAILGRDLYVLVFGRCGGDGSEELGFGRGVCGGGSATRATVREGAVGVGDCAVGVAGLALDNGLRRGGMNVQEQGREREEEQHGSLDARHGRRDLWLQRG